MHSKSPSCMDTLLDSGCITERVPSAWDRHPSCAWNQGFSIKHEANFCTHKEVPNKQSHLPSKNTWTSFKTVVANLCCLVTSLKGNVTNFTHGTSFYRSWRETLPVWIRAKIICGYWGSRLKSAKLHQGMRPTSARFGRTSLDRNKNPGGA